MFLLRGNTARHGGLELPHCCVVIVAMKNRGTRNAQVDSCLCARANGFWSNPSINFEERIDSFTCPQGPKLFERPGVKNLTAETWHHAHH